MDFSAGFSPQVGDGMNTTNNPSLTPFAQRLRREMTPEEKHLWFDCLKKLPVTVQRQKVIGSYIVDFCCASRKLIIEVDGIQHQTEENKAYDKARDTYLTVHGYTVVRYKNKDINTNFNAVCSDILKQLGF